MRWGLSRMLLKVKHLLLRPISIECEVKDAVPLLSQPLSTSYIELILQHLWCLRLINSCIPLGLNSSLQPQDKNSLRLSLPTIISRKCNQEELATSMAVPTSRTKLSSNQIRSTLLVEVHIKVSSQLDTKVAYNTIRLLQKAKKDQTVCFKRLMWVVSSINRTRTPYQAFHPALWTSHQADPSHNSSASPPRAIEATMLRDSWPLMSGPSQGCSLPLSQKCPKRVF